MLASYQGGPPSLAPRKSHDQTVVHLVLSRSAGCAQIPLILAGKPAPSDTELGSKIYTTRPIAVLTGAGYDEAAVEDMMKATAEQKDTKPIP